MQDNEENTDLRLFSRKKAYKSGDFFRENPIYSVYPKKQPSETTAVKYDMMIIPRISRVSPRICPDRAPEVSAATLAGRLSAARAVR